VTNVTAQTGTIEPNRATDDYEHQPSVAAATTSGAASEHEHQHEHEKTQNYTCVMHPDVISDHPGNCPKCGMKLVPLKEKKRPTPNSDKSRAGVQRPTSNARSTETHQSHMAHASHEMHEMHMAMEMNSSINLADPMSREGSGTSWLPDSSPMYGRMFMFGENMLMLPVQFSRVTPT
jgi:hypothetical protein